ncbi:MAG: acetylornithine/succinylornithine family transaminase [Candidatus Bipolaricaulota bacterium]|nr:acetylornithine/succinylornithine family transaminase [Candidatus Bipolaricaulota bacterium]MCS7274451.1 acetylornithine/succinylornithine family transaminase [Candidatus Bipolaricaulota bacterium]MDW8110880.1 acetylornithine/succinylornithine family transaminase [Candidatus Bipolaricaulota bacterium]MDW8329353.1 acetylornithine/succinylornithine family transaminase [Candidatus Bipolaricaulota bacterium]
MHTLITAQAILEIEDRHASGVYSKKPIVLVRGRGTRVWDIEGREYLDCATGMGVALVGHANEHVVRAITEQAQRLLTCPDGHFYNDARAALIEKLFEIAPKNLKRVFLCNTGTEAIEGAIKFARGFTKKPGIIAMMRGFHGRTLGALSATWNPKYREPFEPLVPQFSFVPFGDIEKLESAITDETAAVLLEPVQGEGGVHVATVEYLQAVRRLCSQKNILLILDEIQTGFGRTGRLFACEHAQIEPDILCLSKSMGGGVPIGAVLLREDIKLEKAEHGSTFGGNPLACAAARATIEYILERDLVRQAREHGAYFLSRLKELEGFGPVRQARGLGLMLGLELKEKSAPYLTKLIEHGILALQAGPTVMRFLPPLEISRAEIDHVIETLQKIF